MGNATIWYKPEGATRGVRINLGRRLTSREGPNVQYQSSFSSSLGGVSVTVVHSGRMDCRIGLTWQRTGNDATDAGSVLRRRIWGLQAHLKRGGYCTFAEDADYAWAAFASRPPELGGDGLAFNTPVITKTISPSASPSGREIYSHTDADAYITEMKRCSSILTQSLQIDHQWVEDYSDARWVLVRESGTYPAMRVPPPLRSQNFLTHDRDRIFYLDLPLEEDPDRLEDLSRSGGELQDEDEAPQGYELPGDLNPFDPFSGSGRYRF